MKMNQLLLQIKNIIIVSIVAFVMTTATTVLAIDYPKNSSFKFERFLIQPPLNSLTPEPEKGFQTADLVGIKVTIDNPSGNPIRAARLWLNFPKDKVTVTQILDTGAFDLKTPGENEIDSINGVIKLGRGITGAPINAKNIDFATFILQINTETPNDIISLDFHGFSSDKESKAVIHVVDNYLPIRVLPDTKPKPYSFKVNIIDVPENTNETLVENTTLPETASPNGLVPPPNIIACSDGTDVTFTWDLPEIDIEGFYIYYSPRQGTFLHRKTLPKVKAYSFTNLQLGSTQYFMISSFKGNEESTKTEEFKVNVGGVPCQPVFSDLSNLVVLKTDSFDSNNLNDEENQFNLPDKTPETGPDALILLIASSIFLITFIGISVFRRSDI